MKIIWSSDDNENRIIKFNKKEYKVVKNIIGTDKYIVNKFEVHDLDNDKFLFSKKGDVNIEDCTNYIKLCLADDTVKSITKKLKKGD